MNMTMWEVKNGLTLCKTVKFLITEYRAHLAKVAHKNICSKRPASSIDIRLRITG